jgi:hypothetical protein
VPAPRPRKISDFKPTFSNLAQTSHYQLIFGGLSSELRSHLRIRGVDSRFISDTVGLLCSSASLPGSSLGTADITGNFMGVAEKMAHSRLFTQIDLEFYVDSDYKTMKFLEHWVEFIASGSGENQSSDGYYFRMRYPEEYKCNQTKIIKFDRDYKKYIEYTFFGMFPIAFNSTAVSYAGSDVLKASASFNFDRYVSGSVRSVDINRGYDNNKDGLNNTELTNPFASLPTNSENLSYNGVVIDNNPLAETKITLESGFKNTGDVSSFYPK